MKKVITLWLLLCLCVSMVACSGEAARIEENTAQTHITAEATLPAQASAEAPAEPRREPQEDSVGLVSIPQWTGNKGTNDTGEQAKDYDYVINTNTGKFHCPECSSVDLMNDENRWEFYGSREEIIEMGYVPCKRCEP